MSRFELELFPSKSIPGEGVPMKNIGTIRGKRVRFLYGCLASSGRRGLVQGVGGKKGSDFGILTEKRLSGHASGFLPNQ